MMYGYARVSTKEQNLERQLEQLKAFSADIKIIEEKESGKNFNRPKYQLLVHNDLDMGLRAGDLLVICSLDRLGRNYTEIKQEWDYITNTLKANIKVLDMPLLDTSISKDNLDGRFIADLVLQILSYTAEKERENTRKRQAQGIAVMPVVNGKKVSSKTGNPIGRPNAEYPDKWTEIYSNWRSGNITATAAMEILELKRTTFYKLVKSYEA
ncbi:recombinase family protein [uncultured Ruminococcus sp.]|uniref:recombinase family protein n=1 Tax=uncultured Ruminococcus sp. TaxID=165186 RepID=UPI0025FFF326|nr:recombinase family protein [uncultured Ruminococcus sp.]